MLHRPRIRRPYEKKRVSKAGAFIFGIGLVALITTIFILSSVIIPDITTRLDNLSYRARTVYRKLIPHPEYLPTPASVVAVSTASITPLPNQPLLSQAGSAPDTALENVSDTIVINPTPIPQATPASVSLSAPVIPENNLLRPSSDQNQLTGFNHQWQTWNNCGPATVTTYMSYFGHSDTQADAARYLKPNRDDKNVTPQELAAYVRLTGLEAVVRQGGSLDLLKQFTSNNFPVLLETWLVHDGDGLGHYRLITGYDDQTERFNTLDSLNGPDFTVSYDQLDTDWRVFNRLYIVVYPSDQADVVAAIIGEDLNDKMMYERLLSQAQGDLERNPNDAIAYFNRGEALTRLGHPQEAVVAFDQARQLGLHWRRLWYQFAPFEAYYAIGRYQDVLDLAEATLEGAGGLEEAYYYQGLARHATGQGGVIDSLEAALTYNPNFAPAAEALKFLEGQ